MKCAMIRLPRNTYIYDDPEALAQAAATAALQVIEASTSQRIAVCLTGGETPKRLHQLLLNQRLPWDRLHWFWGDERYVPLTDSRSNAGSVLAALLGRTNRADAVHIISTNVESPAKSAQLYEAELKSFYGAANLEPGRLLFDLVFLGIGEDGHIASLFPSSPALEERERWVSAVEQAGQEPIVPRVTLTFRALQSAKEVMFLVSGARKRKAMGLVATGSRIPATMLRPVGRTHWFIDRAAAPEGTW